MNSESSLKNLRELIGKASESPDKTNPPKKNVPESSKPVNSDSDSKQKSLSGSSLPGLPENRTPIPPFTLAPDLPVSRESAVLEKAIRDNPVIIVCGETGSGKTTQLPKICLLAGRGRHGLIGHTQLRRIAASSVAKRIAEELKTPLGDVVGYKVRFTDKTNPGASIKLMTDGILLAETQTDPLLKKYDTIIIDEAHERSVNIDFLLGYLKRLLMKRRDLRVIVTSATIDSERFAKHFAQDGKPAPVFTVSGRMYPVDIRYRPFEDADEDDDKTLMDSVADAVDELEMAGRGDILVFLPGEREIREATDVLLRRHRPGTIEVLPLYARLSSEDQERVFKRSGVRRIVLATNVAETSITVPGIRYVVDTGLARVKRYSYRNKVEQLLIEPVSRASADQRAGRCGRVGPGICVRLYSELDYQRRPPFTDPEIVRSNLASVILRMKALKLGDVREFPFVQAPPARAISDGLAILGELNAIDDKGNLTRTGRELAKLPIDPKLSRILLAAKENGSLREALIIVSGLAVQDPRERPAEAAAAADAAHKEFADPKSDFMSYLRLWNWFVDANANKESNRLLAVLLKKKFLSPRRLREWRDVWRQLGDLTRELGWVANAADATFEEIHSALLTGLLGNVGMRQLDADLKAPPFLGARGIHFWIWPGSALAKKAGHWILAAEIVETSRLFARCVADIEPEWIERAARHVIKKSWSDPHWEKSRGQVVAFEKGTLYGMAVYGNRRVSFTEHDPVLSRELFIRAALVDGDFDCRASFFNHNRRLIRDIEEIEHKTRRQDVLVDDETIFHFYDEKIPKAVVDAVSFDVWRKKAEAVNPKLLFLTRDDLMRKDAAGAPIDFYPKTLDMAGVTMPLTYYFEPGSYKDGVTLVVPIYVLNQIDAVRAEWLVPGMLRDKVQALLKSLPQRIRRHCVPLKDYAQGFFERNLERSNLSVPLIDALIDDLKTTLHLTCARSDFKTETLSPHLFMNFKVIDEHGRQLGVGRNLSELRSELGDKAQDEFRHMVQADATRQADADEKIVDWTFGELPEIMEIRRKGQSLIGHPALVDCKTYCTLEVFDDPEEARRSQRAGLRRLFFLQLREQVRFLEKNLTGLQTVQMRASVIDAVAPAFESYESLRDDLIAATVESVALYEPWPTNEAQFRERREEAKGKINLVGRELARALESVVAELSGIPKRLAASRAFPDIIKDIKEQLKGLFPKSFLLTTPHEQLRHYVRYVRAINVRLDKLRNAPERDAVQMQAVAKLFIPYAREVAARKGVVDERLEAFRWMLEELRVSLFAQELRTPMPVSVKRLTKVWESIRRL
ncbi:MAG TPA: ATP-dependent RNA helicase HrpA [Sutterella sp.]|nr:ATP-dependent RNA helicase HrpA [Sutterella sp.]